MHFGVWQIVMIVLICLGVGISIAKHGEQRTDKYNAWSTLISAAIEITVLALGGFFSK